MQPFQNEKAQLIMTLRGMGIVDADVLAAIEQVPREIFICDELPHTSSGKIDRKKLVESWIKNNQI